MLRTIGTLCIAAMLGVVGASSTTCGIGLLSGISTWCGFPLVWLVGFPLAIVTSVVLGFPALIIFRKLGFSQWWQFIIGGLLLAVPVWYELAQPFTSTRWLHAGFFDSLNYLGSGMFGGLAFWWFSARGVKTSLTDHSKGTR